MIGTPPVLTLVLVELPVAAPAEPEPVELPVWVEELEPLVDEVDPVVEAAVLAELPTAPAVMVTGIGPNSDASVNEVVVTVDVAEDDTLTWMVPVQTPKLELMMLQFNSMVLQLVSMYSSGIISEVILGQIVVNCNGAIAKGRWTFSNGDGACQTAVLSVRVTAGDRIGGSGSILFSF